MVELPEVIRRTVPFGETVLRLCSNLSKTLQGFR